MESSTHRGLSRDFGPQPFRQVSMDTAAFPEAQWIPATIARAFTQMRLAQRVRVLRRLLLPVGPMALAVIGGGVFAKYAAQARWPRMPLSLEDAARVTASQVYELVRYVQQSNPHVLEQVLVVVARDSAAMDALGASVATVVTRHVASRRGSHTTGGAGSA